MLKIAGLEAGEAPGFESARSAPARRNLELKPEIARVFAENFVVYGVRKVWRQMRREEFAVSRCTVDRLMHEMGLQGAIRGKPVRTTISDKAAPCRLDHVIRQFATLEWVDWFNNRRLLQPIGNVPPAEAEDAYYATIEPSAMAA